jgi:hypothetical protein
MLCYQNYFSLCSLDEEALPMKKPSCFCGVNRHFKCNECKCVCVCDKMRQITNLRGTHAKYISNK